MENNIDNSLVQMSEQNILSDLSASNLVELSSLKSNTEDIKYNIDEIKDSYFEIGLKLSEIKDYKVYSVLGYDDFYSYCEEVFGFKKTFTSNLISVSGKFKSEEFEGSSISTLIELLPLSENKSLCNDLKNSTVKEIRETKNSLNKIDLITSEFLIKEYGKLKESFDLKNDCISDFSISTDDHYYVCKATFSYALEVISIKKSINFIFSIALDDDGSIFYRISVDYKSHSLCEKLVCKDIDVSKGRIDYKDEVVSNFIYKHLRNEFSSIEDAEWSFDRVAKAVSLATKFVKPVTSESVAVVKHSSHGLTNDKKRMEFLEDENNWELVSELSSEDLIVRKLTVKNTYYVVYYKDNFNNGLIFYKYESYYDKGKFSASYLYSTSKIVDEMKDVGF